MKNTCKMSMRICVPCHKYNYSKIVNENMCSNIKYSIYFKIYNYLDKKLNFKISSILLSRKSLINGLHMHATCLVIRCTHSRYTSD